MRQPLRSAEQWCPSCVDMGIKSRMVSYTKQFGQPEVWLVCEVCRRTERDREGRPLDVAEKAGKEWLKCMNGSCRASFRRYDLEVYELVPGSIGTLPTPPLACPLCGGGVRLRWNGEL